MSSDAYQCTAPPLSASATTAMRFPLRFYLNTWGDFALVAAPAPRPVRLRRNQRLYGDPLVQGVMTTAILDQIARKSLFSAYFIRIFLFC